MDSTKPNYGVVRDHPELLDINMGTLFMYGDWIHANIVEYNELRDEIVFTSHFLNELYVIDHSTTTEEARGHSGGRHGKGGDIIYRWGNPQNYDRGGPSDQHFWVVHGANWIKPGLVGEGNILVFNNGDRPGTANDYSSVEEITPPLDSNDRYYIHPDSAYGPAGPSWVYKNPGVFYSGHMSGAYRMPNGNTFITEAVSGRLSEVTRDGRVVWQKMTATWNGRAIKYPRDYMTGVAECPPPAPPGPGPRTAFMRDVLRLEAGGTLFDCRGCRVARLRAGTNDLSGLAPGAYFLRPDGRRPADVIRVTVTGR